MEKAVPKPGQKRKACPCTAPTLEKAPKKASKAKRRENRTGTLKPDKATGAPPIANIGEKVKHGRSKVQVDVRDRWLPAATGGDGE